MNSIWNKKEVGKLRLQVEGDTLYVYPQRDLDMAEAKRFRIQVDGQLFARSSIQRLVVNLAQVNFIDSSGLGALLGRYKLMQSRQGEMILQQANEQVYRILEISGMKTLMPIMQAEEEKKRSGSHGERE